MTEVRGRVNVPDQSEGYGSLDAAHRDTVEGVSKRVRNARSAVAALSRACFCGSAAAVAEAIRDGADVTRADVGSWTPLMLACRRNDWPEVQTIVHVLLEHRAPVRVADHRGYTALHFAAQFASSATVAMLLASGAQAAAVAEDAFSPLHCCCGRDTADDTVDIATLLLDAGADIDGRERDRCTPLLLACAYSDAALVALLLARGADVKAIEAGRRTTLMYACDNAVHGPAIVPLLIGAGVDVGAASANGNTALLCAYNHSGVIMRSLAPHMAASDQLAGRHPFPLCADPIGAMTEATAYGLLPDSNHFGAAAMEPPEFCWSMLRNGAPLCFDGSHFDAFVRMATCTDARLWHLVVGELNVTRHPVTGDTLLHVAARHSISEAVSVCIAYHLNPLLRNAAGQMAIDCAVDSNIRATLRNYAAWRPVRHVARWYGPYFHMRARAWLLVCARWASDDTRSLPIEVQRMVVARIADSEETFVRRLSAP